MHRTTPSRALNRTASCGALPLAESPSTTRTKWLSGPRTTTRVGRTAPNGLHNPRHRIRNHRSHLAARRAHRTLLRRTRVWRTTVFVVIVTEERRSNAKAGSQLIECRNGLRCFHLAIVRMPSPPPLNTRELVKCPTARSPHSRKECRADATSFVHCPFVLTIDISR